MIKICISVTSHALDHPRSLCHKLSHLLGPLPLERDVLYGRPLTCITAAHYGNRLIVNSRFLAPTKAKSRKPAYSQALVKNKIDRQGSDPERQAGRQSEGLYNSPLSSYLGVALYKFHIYIYIYIYI